MFDKYLFVTKIFIFLLYIVSPLYILMYAETKTDYLTAALVLAIGFAFNYVINNKDNEKVIEFLAKWF